MLLHTPLATDEPIGWMDAYFASTSAAMVTGLSSVDIETTFTPFGELVLMALMQVGGLGLMTFALLTAALLGKRIGLRHRLITGQSLNVATIGGTRSLVRLILLFALSMEALGTLVLAIRFVPDLGLARGLWVSMFHAVSAFNNAGFSTFSTNLTGYVADPVVNIAITGLFIVGGIGFVVVADLVRTRTFARLSLHTKLMLVGTLVMNVLATLLVLTFEWGNAGTLGSLDLDGKLWAGWFQAVSPRTAGFNTVDMAELTDPTLLLMMLLMFIGAGSASTAGGIKLSTFIVILLFVLTFLRGRSEPSAFGRSVAYPTVVKALAIAIIGCMVVFTMSLALVAIEPLPMQDLLFEAVSAFGTVGLSTGITADLSDRGKGILMFLMFMGRVGPLTLAYSLAAPRPVAIRYPTDDVLAG